MAANFRFRWWYLLALLPLLLYLVADWYVGRRIDRAIADANTDGNSLTVSDYDYGFFPIALTARGITFDQSRPALTAAGTLSLLEVSKLNLFSLLGSGPIQLARVHLSGLDAQASRQQVSEPKQDSSNFAIEVTDVSLDSVFLQLTDEPTGRQLALQRFALSVGPLAFPLQVAAVRKLQVAADSAQYFDPRDSLRASITDMTYATASGTISARGAQLQRGGATDLRLQDIRLSGINQSDLRDGITIDSLIVADLGGSAQVPGSSQPDQPTPADSPTPPGTSLELGHFAIRTIDVSVSGAFGQASLAGSVTATDMRYADSLAIGSVSLNGQTLTFDNGQQLAVSASDLSLQQGKIQLPLRPESLGPTQVRIPELTVRSGQQTITVAGLDYGSADGTLRGQEITVRGERISASIPDVRLIGIDRDGFVAGGPLSAAQAILTGADVTIRTADGGSYRISAPELTLTDLNTTDGFQTARAQLTDGSVRRRGSSGEEDLVARGIYLDQYGLRAPFKPAQLGPTKLRVAHLDIYGEEEPVDYTLDRIAYSSRQGTLTLDSINRRNQLSSAETFRQQLSKSWLTFAFDGLRASGIDHLALLQGEAITVDSLTARDVRVFVVEDVAMAPPSKKKYMPIEALRTIGPRIKLGTARLRSTDIAYGVIDTVLDPKTIHFGEGIILLEGLDTEVSTSDSIRLTFDATFERATPLHAEFALARDSSGRNFAMRGQLGQYDLSGINPLFEVAADAFINSGIIEGMQYRGALQDEVLTGSMDMLYRNLDVELVGGGAWFKNLLSGLVLKEENSRGEEFRQGSMYHEHSADRSFFNAYWKGLMSGMKSSAMADIALQKELD
ncbi:hypothetical protein LEM8419_00834 [Neolewinella maritima]|uniref:DUF748 domain-containing protein n=1 Tax=Neolewinella maritima TaxID=1383882 RepID=A0ABN8EZZ3_9BACT|nr:hypothetical protein [Neolewinella maritima]CAH0999534.1 hypothetical protein LEM8419_00834 [Neolewinella maritima]